MLVLSIIALASPTFRPLLLPPSPMACIMQLRLFDFKQKLYSLPSLTYTHPQLEMESERGREGVK